MTLDPLAARDTSGATNCRLVPIEAEPGWAHVWATLPDGSDQALSDYHLPCGSMECLTLTMPDGTRRHVCRRCTAAEALARQEG